ncbi:hypothetical protein EL17_19045 [Anditalea andensis]|uniref:Uncharacterized protein n=1 Tax=Anditalea andensis TaxID=1048983 RepID=A0A074KPY6_9BACT|nr:hypothetical protein EL17_19045 [Anditalea andensis]
MDIRKSVYLKTILFGIVYAIIYLLINFVELNFSSHQEIYAGWSAFSLIYFLINLVIGLFIGFWLMYNHYKYPEKEEA